MDRHQQRQAYWQGKITEWAQSGQPVSAWCTEHDVSPGRFYLWRRHLQEWISRPYLPRPLPSYRFPKPSRQP